MIYFSPWSISMLKKDNLAWYKWYVKNVWEFWFNPYMKVWVYLHKSLENRAIDGVYNKELYLHEMKRDFEKENCSLIYDDIDFEKRFNNALDKFIALDYPKPNVAEKTIKYSLSDYRGYWLKIKVDWIRENWWWDYKFVSKITPKDRVKEKYWESIRFYQYVMYKTTLQKLDWKVIEIPVDEWDVNIIKFERSDDIITENEEIIRKCVIKANWLQSLPLDSVL